MYNDYATIPRISKVTKFPFPSWAEACHRWEDGTRCTGCYAYALYQYRKSVKLAWDSNKAVSNKELYKFVTDYCTLVTPRFFRVNTSGELNPGRLKTWINVAKKCKSTTFWTYTKEIWVSRYKLPDNLIIHVNPDINYGKLEELTEMVIAQPDKYYICPSYMDTKERKACGRTCFQCMDKCNKKLPLFVKHGGESNTKKK